MAAPEPVLRVEENCFVLFPIRYPTVRACILVLHVC